MEEEYFKNIYPIPYHAGFDKLFDNHTNGTLHLALFNSSRRAVVVQNITIFNVHNEQFVCRYTCSHSR
ncbi:hypothetical protein DPMN_038087 [Dreissena polymorpha]|uniref:Uncharacterized protein n=1 Tax=Dreissena polymorpha TaxID=45954 RepID=A0A9D4MES4_DREPO|nr:hypothetical protein DPMN_038087 [Dreissena polymorpha]